MIRKKVQFSAKDVEIVSMTAIKLWKDNPRNNADAVSKLSKIIAAHGGQRTPVVVWRKNKVIYKGNTTYKAMKLLGMTQIAVLWSDFPSEQAAIAYGIADNRSSEFSDWDHGILSKLMMAKSIDIRMTGFVQKEIDLFSVKQSSNAIKLPKLREVAAQYSKKEHSLSILNYAMSDGKRFVFSDLDTFAIVECAAKTGMYSIKDIVDGLPLTDCMTDIDVAEFPVLPEIDTEIGKISVDQLVPGTFASSDNTRSTLCGICVDGTNEICFATDGSFGAFRPINKSEINCSIPPIISRFDGAEIKVYKKYAVLDGWYYVKLIDGLSPQFNKVLPKKFTHECAFAVPSIAKYSDTATKLCILKGACMYVRRLDGKLLCFNVNGNFGDTPIGVNIYSLEKLVGANKLHISTNIGAMVFDTPNSLKYILMPLRIIDETTDYSMAIQMQSEEVRTNSSVSYSLSPGSIRGTVNLQPDVMTEFAMQNLFGAESGKKTEKGWEYFGGDLIATL